MNDIDFEQELYKHFGQIKDFTLGMRIGQYFYELGKHSGSSEIPNDLEEYASRAGFDYVDNIVQEHPGHRFNDHDVEYAYRDGIIAGAKWQKQHDAELIEIAYNDGITIGMTKQKEQMLKEAVEGEYDKYPAAIYLSVPLPRMNNGDKVRIIIVKER